MARHLARARILALAILIIALSGFAFPLPVEAEGIAISGSFYLQHFEFIPGQSLTTPDIYVVVFNKGENDMTVKLTPHAPLGVELILPTTDFTLPPGESEQIEVGINVGPQVPPGEYDLALTAEAFREGEGIKLAGAAQQQAKLTIIAESGEVDISTVSPKGEPFPATIRLYKKIEGQNLPCGYSQTGELQGKFTPGDYLVEAYYQGRKIAEQTFRLEADERKTITLVPQTVYIEGFAVVPNHYTETGELAFAKIVYTINNTYQSLKDVTASLKVSFEDGLVDETELICLPTLAVGITTDSYNYIPSQGWQRGTYNFKIELYAEGEFYATTLQEDLEVTAPSATPVVSWSVLGKIIAGALIIIAVIVAAILIRRRRALRT